MVLRRAARLPAAQLQAPLQPATGMAAGPGRLARLGRPPVLVGRGARAVFALP